MAGTVPNFLGTLEVAQSKRYEQRLLRSMDKTMNISTPDAELPPSAAVVSASRHS